MTTPLPTALDEPWHGTENGYSHKKCRCDPCTQAFQLYARNRRKKNKQKIRGDEPWHGTENGYNNYSCRCNDCKAADSAAAKNRRNENKQKIRGDEPWHGTKHGYNAHLCRCDPCCFASTIYSKKRNYGISEEKAKQLLLINKCEICGTQNPANKKGFYFDHDHFCCPKTPTCGKCLRGILCHKCNTIIGFASDDLEILKAAISYLERYSA